MAFRTTIVMLRETHGKEVRKTIQGCYGFEHLVDHHLRRFHLLETRKKCLPHHLHHSDNNGNNSENPKRGLEKGQSKAYGLPCLSLDSHI